MARAVEASVGRLKSLKDAEKWVKDTAGDLRAVAMPLESGTVPADAKLGKFDRRCRRQGVVPVVYVLDGWCPPWTPGAGTAGD